MRLELTTLGLEDLRANQLRHNCGGSKQVMRFELTTLGFADLHASKLRHTCLKIGVVNSKMEFINQFDLGEDQSRSRDVLFV